MKKLMVIVLMFFTVSLFSQGMMGPNRPGFIMTKGGLPLYLTEDYRNLVTPMMHFWMLPVKDVPAYTWRQRPDFRALIQAVNEAELEARFLDWHPPFVLHVRP